MGILIGVGVGGFAGWIAEKIMKSDMGIVMNVVLGVVGAMVANFLLGLIGASAGAGLIGYLIAGVGGACLLIWIGRQMKERS